MRSVEGLAARAPGEPASPSRGGKLRRNGARRREAVADAGVFVVDLRAARAPRGHVLGRAAASACMRAALTSTAVPPGTTQSIR